jgi:hypothetical protein
MSNETPKLPNPNAVKELRDLYNRRKEERFKKHKEFGEILKKKSPIKKIAKTSDLPDVEI